MLIEKVACHENLWAAFRECSRGKRSKLGYQRFLFSVGEHLSEIRTQILRGQYRWHGYRTFMVQDPKARKVMAAPFCDRVVHHALHRVIEPILDPLLSPRTFACRKGKGTSAAVECLIDLLYRYGSGRYVIKLDIESFFASIPRDVLLKSLAQALPDSSLDVILESLVNSSDGGPQKRGIPIGNLTSQLFANWTLQPLDAFVEKEFPMVEHVRYMDDIVLVGTDKNVVMQCAHALVKYARQELGLSIPFTKFVPLAAAPVPFLGFLLSHDSVSVLSRNRMRFVKHMQRLRKRGFRESRIAQAQLSHDAWEETGQRGMALASLVNSDAAFCHSLR